MIISGLFMIFAAAKYGLKKFKREYIDRDSDFKISSYYFVPCMIFNIGLGLVLIYWWMSQGYSEYPWFDQNSNWNVISVYSNASILTQWLVVIVTGILFNGYLYRKFGPNNP